MAKEMIVQGKKVNASIIAAYAKRVGSLDEILSVWANAGAIQLAEHGNMNWLEKLFSMPVLRLKNGDLSKLGTEVRQYVSAHYPALKWDAENQKVVRSKVGKDSIMNSHFVDLLATDATAEGMVEQRGKFWRPLGDFSMTLIEWRNFVADNSGNGGDEETAPTVTAKAFVKQLDKALAALEVKRFVGAEDELSAALGKLMAVQELLVKATAKATDAAPTIDADAVHQLLQSGQAGKSARAGGKVEGEATEVAA